ncbi:hypothetical protein PIROE2DRAFT_1893, partial [Piromyces sp. E2]
KNSTTILLNLNKYIEENHSNLLALDKSLKDKLTSSEIYDLLEERKRRKVIHCYEEFDLDEYSEDELIYESENEQSNSNIKGAKDEVLRELSKIKRSYYFEFYVKSFKESLYFKPAVEDFEDICNTYDIEELTHLKRARELTILLYDEYKNGNYPGINRFIQELDNKNKNKYYKAKQNKTFFIGISIVVVVAVVAVTIDIGGNNNNNIYYSYVII